MLKNLLAVLLLFPTICIGEDWPQWRGPNRDGQWNAEGIVDELPDGQIPLEWSIPIGPGYNGPTVAEGRVYVMDRQVDGNKQTERVLCVDSGTGQKIWEHVYEAAYSIGYTAGPRASVTIDSGRAYAVGAMGYFHCFDASTGKILWERDLQRELNIEMPIWGIAASPLVFDGLVIQQIGGGDKACMVALNAANGTEVWRSLDEKAGYASPIVIQQKEQPVLVCWTGESLSGLNPKTGNRYWSHAMPPSRMPIGIVTPVYDRQRLFVSSFYDGSLMVTAPTDALTSQKIWRAVGPDEQHTSVDSVQTAGGLLTDGPFGIHIMIGTPIVDGDYIYGFDSYGEFRCLEASTGRRVWEDLTIVPKLRWGMGHMVRQGDRTWIFNDQGELMIAKLSPEGIDVLSRGQLIETTTVQLNRRNGVCWSHPAFAEKSIFARNDNRLVRASLAK
ncbi:MAG: PQQ-binding-like beta-propeller repeat protein [Pirellulaceae bacterium]